MEKAEEQTRTLKTQIDRLHHRAAYWKSKCNDLEIASGEEVARVLVKEESKCIQL